VISKARNTHRDRRLEVLVSVRGSARVTRAEPARTALNYLGTA